MTKVEARCTQCAHTEYGSPSQNTNSVTYTVDPREIDHGTGNAHGTEKFTCPQCSETCDREECSDEDPCEHCAVETLHNRCGSSVPRV